MAAATLRCLFVSPVVPHPPDSGGRIRTFQLIKALQGRAEIHLRAVLDPGDGAQRLRALEPYCASVQGFERATPSAWERWSRPKIERWFHSPSLATALNAECARGNFDVVHLDEMFLTRAAESLATPHVIHHHKLDTRFQELTATQNPFARAFDSFKLRRLEAFAARLTQFHVMTSAPDAAMLRRRYSTIDTSVVENGFDPEHFKPPTSERARDELLFLGSMDYAPNIDGMTWFVREVLPMILSERPGVRVRIVGRAPTPAVRALAGENVVVTGAVEDVRPALTHAAAMVVPLRIGGGTRIKIVEAMGCETPVVSTSIGAEGLRFRDPEHLWIADSAPAFAARTLELLSDARGARDRAHRGRGLALEYYRWSELAGRLLAVWQRATESRGEEAG